MSIFPQIYAIKELAILLQNKDGPNQTVIFNIPYLQVPITQHDFKLVKFTIGISSFTDLFLNITNEVSESLNSISFHHLCFIYSSIQKPTNLLTSQASL